MTLRGERKVMHWRRRMIPFCTVLHFFLRTPQCGLTHIYIWCTCVCWKNELEKTPESLTLQSCLSLKQQPGESSNGSPSHSPRDQSHPGWGIFRKWGHAQAGRKHVYCFFLCCFFASCSLLQVCPEGLPLLESFLGHKAEQYLVYLTSQLTTPVKTGSLNPSSSVVLNLIHHTKCPRVKRITSPLLVQRHECRQRCPSRN